MDNRLGQYKNHGKESGRANRADEAVSIRKEKRTETLNKRRNLNEETEEDISSEASSLINEMSISKIVAGCNSDDIAVVRECVERARKLLATTPCPPINALVAEGIVPILINALNSQDTKVQFDSAWAITNIASGSSENTKAVVDCGAVPELIKLLTTGDMEVCEQSVWALGNIIGDRTAFRDLCLVNGLLSPLLAFINPDIGTQFLRNVCWVIVNVCRPKDSPLHFEACAAIVGGLAQLLCHTDTEVLVDAAWAVSYMTDAGNDRIGLVISAGIVPMLAPLLGHTNVTVQTACLRSLGSIVTGSDEQTQHVLDCGVLKYLPGLIKLNKPKITKEVIWFLSNIAAGPPEQVEMLIEAKMFPVIINSLSYGDFQTQKEAVWAVANIAISGRPAQVENLVDEGVMTPYCRLLSSRDAQMTEVILDGINHILQNSGVHQEDWCRQIEECGALDVIENLQNHENEAIYKNAFDIIDNYFSDVSSETDGTNMVDQAKLGVWNF